MPACDKNVVVDSGGAAPLTLGTPEGIPRAVSRGNSSWSPRPGAPGEGAATLEHSTCTSGTTAVTAPSAGPPWPRGAQAPVQAAKPHQGNGVATAVAVAFSYYDKVHTAGHTSSCPALQVALD